MTKVTVIATTAAAALHLPSPLEPKHDDSSSSNECTSPLSSSPNTAAMATAAATAAPPLSPPVRTQRW